MGAEWRSPFVWSKASVAWTSVKTVDNHLMTVREKFKIDDTGICLSESYKRGLIKY
jgi:hypothetical protein